jgi:hypothetical protein
VEIDLTGPERARFDASVVAVRELLGVLDAGNAAGN